MEMEALGIAGAYLCKFDKFEDDRGSFQEWFSKELFEEILPEPFSIIQANASFSKRDVIRGIHYSLSELGQSKFVSCFAGHIKDTLVDLRLGSPTYLQTQYIDLAGEDSLAIYIPTGVGHGFQAMQDDSLVVYLLTSKYSPTEEFTVNAFDPALRLSWANPKNAVLSPKDQEAPHLSSLQNTNLLPIFKSESILNWSL